MNDTIALELTKQEYFLLVGRYEKSLERDTKRGDSVNDVEFVLLRKLIGLNK